MRKKGFTLIELIMVIVIIGILAAIAVPRFIDLRAQARIAACEGSGAALRSAISNYYASAAINDVSTEYPTALTNAVMSLYIQEWPDSPTASGTWNDFYTSSTGVVDVATACQ